jgi:multidrug efflux pump
VPAEDRGRVDVMINGPEGSGFDATVRVADRIEKILDKYRKEGVAERTIITVPRFGQNQFNTGNAGHRAQAVGRAKQIR